MVVRAMVTFWIRDGTLSGIMTLQMICRGVAPILCAASMMLGSTSRRLLSTRRATNGNAATTSGTMVAVVPTAVPMMSRDRGNTMIIRIRKGTERRRLMMTLSTCSSQRGSGSTPFFSPATSRTPSGSPSTSDNRVLSTVT